jgi:hypothetical protein
VGSRLSKNGKEGLKMAIKMIPIQHTEVFNLSPFSSNPNYPYTPAMIGSDGFEYAHCGCQTLESAIATMEAYQYGCDSVFGFVLHHPNAGKPPEIVKAVYFFDSDPIEPQSPKKPI